MQEVRNTIQIGYFLSDYIIFSMELWLYNKTFYSADWLIFCLSLLFVHYLYFWQGKKFNVFAICSDDCVLVFLYSAN